MKRKLGIIASWSIVLVTVLSVATAHRVSHLCEAEGESSEECQPHFQAQSGKKSVEVPVLRSDYPSPPQVRFFLHTNSRNPNYSVEIFTDDITSVEAATPHRSEPEKFGTWKVLIPGYPQNGKSPFPDNVREAYMSQEFENATWPRLNVIVVSWESAGCSPNYQFPNGTTHIEMVGQKVANLLLFLNENRFLELKRDVHVIGSSIGAHVAGEMARYIFRTFAKRNLIYRISALDPLAEKYWPPVLVNHKASRPNRRALALRRSFVEFLDVYHTSDEYGIKRHLGDIDFYPEGGIIQKACNGIVSKRLDNRAFKDLCSHEYATELFAESISSRNILACTGFDDYQQYQRNTKSDFSKCEDQPIVGDAVDEEKTDNIPNTIGRGFFEVNNNRLSQFGAQFDRLLAFASSVDPKYPMC